MRSPVLELSNLEEAEYHFSLKVTDTVGQTDSSVVKIVVSARGRFEEVILVLINSFHVVISPPSSFIATITATLVSLFHEH